MRARSLAGVLAAVSMGCGGGAEVCGPNDFDCAKTGEACLYSINCPNGDICNKVQDRFFDDRLPINVCTKVRCDSDQDCLAPRTCGADHRCLAPPCQEDRACPSGLACVGGRCGSPPSPTLEGCELTTMGRVLFPGGRAALSATGVLASGALSPWTKFGFESDHPEIVRIVDGMAIAQARPGTAVITATAAGVRCTATFTSLPAAAPGTLQVVAAGEEDEAPLAGASVGFWVNGSWREAAADAQGSATSSEVAQAVLVRAPGREPLLIVAPGRGDVLAVLSPAPQDDRARGFRGSVDFAHTPGIGDVRLGIVGSLLEPTPSQLLGALQRSFCELLPTPVDGFFMGLGNVVSPAVVLGMGSQHLTVHRPGCAPHEGTREGCFTALAGQATSGAWAIGGNVRLSDVSAVAGDLVKSGNCVTTGALFFRVSRLEGAHGAIPRLEAKSVPRVPSSGGLPDCSDLDLPDYQGRCQPDPGGFEAVDIPFETPRGVLSLVSIPELPAIEDSAVVVTGSALLPHRGLLPLAMGISRGPGGGLVAPDFPYFNQPRGTHLLAAAPRHAGLEGTPLVLTALAISATVRSEPSAQEASLVSKRVSVFSKTEAFAVPFLPLPRGTYATTTRAFRLSAPVGEGLVRARFRQRGQYLTVLFPADVETMLPELPALAELIGSGTHLLLSVERTGRPYADFLARGSSGHYSRLYEQPSLQVATRACTPGADGVCRLEP
ncbi:MAG: hypothetical protein U1E65_26570 [Myxococcota bacterium]